MIRRFFDLGASVFSGVAIVVIASIIAAISQIRLKASRMPVEKCPVKVWPAEGTITPRQCTRRAIGKRGLCVQHEKMLDRYDYLPLVDGSRIFRSGRRLMPRVPGQP